MLYQDQDIVEIAVTAWNGVFGGTVELYVGQGELEQTAKKPRGFPVSPSDTREITLGTFDSRVAGGGTLLRFFCVDMAGHARLELTLSSKHPLSKQAQRVELFADIDAASIDEFVPLLVPVSRDERTDATLHFADAVMRP